MSSLRHSARECIVWATLTEQSFSPCSHRPLQYRQHAPKPRLECRFSKCRIFTIQSTRTYYNFYCTSDFLTGTMNPYWYNETIVPAISLLVQWLTESRFGISKFGILMNSNQIEPSRFGVSCTGIGCIHGDLIKDLLDNVQ